MSARTKSRASNSDGRFIFRFLKHLLRFESCDRFGDALLQPNEDDDLLKNESNHAKDESVRKDEPRRKKVKHGWKASGWLVIVGISLHVLSVILPYVMATRRKAMEPLLPFISQGASIPPESGVFVFFLVPACLANMIFFGLLFTNINHRITKKLSTMETANRYSLNTGLVLLLGWIIVSVFPCGYTDLLSKYEWVLLVMCGHMIGVAMFILGSVVFVSIHAGLSWFLPDENKKMVILRTSLGFVLIALAPLGCRSFPALAEEEVFSETLDALKAKTYKLPTKFSESYLTTAFCEWTLCVVTWIFLLTFYWRMQKVSFSVVLQTKVSGTPRENETIIEESSKKIISLTATRQNDNFGERSKFYVSPIFLLLQKPSILMTISFCLISYIVYHHWSFFHEYFKE